jgi:hypothetical protein
MRNCLSNTSNVLLTKWNPLRKPKVLSGSSAVYEGYPTGLGFVIDSIARVKSYLFFYLVVTCYFPSPDFSHTYPKIQLVLRLVVKYNQRHK